MRSLDEFKEITRRDEPLAPLTWLKIGGPAQYFITPRSIDELTSVVKRCHEDQIPLHVLGSGSNLLIREEGVSGAVISLAHDSFAKIEIEGNRVRAGAGALLSSTINASVRASLGGLDTLVGIPGTIGGALVGNAGGRSGDIAPHVAEVRGLTNAGELVTRTRDELTFDYRQSNLQDLTLVDVVFELIPDEPEEITLRMRKLWIMKKTTQPLTSQSAGCIFKNPRSMRAGALIEQAGLKGTRLGNAEISDRHANFIVAHPGATSQDVLKLIDLVRSKIGEQFGVDLELEIKIW